MTSTPKFARCDTKKPDGFYIQFERLVLDDDSCEPDYLFQHKEYYLEDQQRLDDFNNGLWNFIGIRAKAKCFIVGNGNGTFINLESPGLWGIESDSGKDYLNEVFEDEKSQLLDLINSMSNPVVEGVTS